ncbi:MAG: acyl carrier protein [Desulfobacteraceae bacterium]|jgi:acyl carrier protein
MEVSAAQLIKGLEELFPECQGTDISVETLLGEMPEWDSMAAVNFQTFLLQQFEMEVPLELLADETSLQEVIAYIENPESALAS